MTVRSMVKEPVRICSPSLAVAFGITQAIFLQQVHYWLDLYASKQDRSHYHEGRWWVYNSYDAWREQLPWLCRDTIKRTIKALRDDGVLITKYRGFPRKMWYSIDYDRVGTLLGDNVSLLLPGEQVQNAPTERGKMPLPVRKKMPLPSYTKNNTKTSREGPTIIRRMWGD